MIYKYPPKLTDSTIEYEIIPHIPPPKAHIGYEKDSDNPWIQHSDWEPCTDRKVAMRPRRCGRALLTFICGSDSAPLKGRLLRPVSCEGCTHAKQ